ncbi:polysaccharide pyruvyl transferase family protein [Phreatobacter sp.]|uniref:polysaccharide pyruvyl transferase family protein n=1 Tax=Phreatobacter sp. TaxID=1966341 RepID=UPI003F70F428
MNGRFKILGNHSAYHAGAAAVWSVLNASIASAGMEIVDTGDFDLLVVNGEGSMHHSRPTFHRKMQFLRTAVERGKKAYLVNSVWEANSNEYDDVLRALDGIVVREILSAEDLRKNHQIEASVCVDLSYFAQVQCSTHPDYSGQDVVSDFYSSEFQDFARITGGPLSKLPYIDMGAMTWPELVCGLRTAGTFVTGRQHGVYAACKARIPFIALVGNTHKIDGLLASAGCSIPCCQSLQQVTQQRSVPIDHEAYGRLFAWMDTHSITDALPFLRSGGG